MGTLVGSYRLGPVATDRPSSAGTFAGSVAAMIMLSESAYGPVRRLHYIDHAQYSRGGRSASLYGRHRMAKKEGRTRFSISALGSSSQDFSTWPGDLAPPCRFRAQVRSPDIFS